MRTRLVVAVLLLTSFSVAQQQRRITRSIDNSSAVRLRGSLVPRATTGLDRGPVLPNLQLQRMTVSFSRTTAQQAALDQLLAEQQDPGSLNYHKWLTPEEFGDRFGLADADVQLLAAWLTSQGFKVEEIAQSRTWIAFSGTAAHVATAFRTPLHNYLVDGVTHYAPSVEPALPDALAGVVAAISGLHDFTPHAHSRVRRAGARLTSSLSGSHFLVPGDFGTIYNLPDYVNGVFQSGLDGSGQTIGIVGQTSSTGTIAPSTISSDTATFRSVSNLPAANLTLTPVGSLPANFSSTEADEGNLDIQWAGAVAPNASIVLAYSSNALTSSLQYPVNQNAASVISISYGTCESDTNFTQTELTAIEGELSQAIGHGQTLTASA